MPSTMRTGIFFSISAARAGVGSELQKSAMKARTLKTSRIRTSAGLSPDEAADKAATGAEVECESVLPPCRLVLNLLGIGAAAGIANQHSLIGALAEERKGDLYCLGIDAVEDR